VTTAGPVTMAGAEGTAGAVTMAVAEGKAGAVTMAGAGAAAVLGRTSLTLKNKYIRIRKGKMFGKGMSLGGGGRGVRSSLSW
jgi:hypothetical protein